MPNWVTTEITADDQVALSKLLDDGGQVTFTHLLPEPANIERGNCSGEHPEGVVCWYQWHVDNWGTKWDASGSEVEAGRVRFETAWAHPLPVLERLSVQCPEVTFVVRYADEDLGSNCGAYLIRGGEVIERTTPEGDEACEFAAQLRYGMSYREVYED